MMTKEEFSILCKGMKAVYTMPSFLPDGDAMNVWYSLLKDLDYMVVQTAVQKYMLTQKTPPTIADIRELCASVTMGDKPLWSDGWEKVQKNISKYGMCTYDPDKLVECMNSFDPLTRQVVKRLGWNELCMSQNAMTDRANFRMIYEQIANREQERKKIPLGMQQLIAKIQGQNLIESREKVE